VEATVKKYCRASKVNAKVDEKIRALNPNYWDLPIETRDSIWPTAILSFEDDFSEKLNKRKRAISFESMQYSTIYEKYMDKKKKQ
jgi:hypothetical protein